MKTLSSQSPGETHVTALTPRAAALVVARCNADPDAEVAFGDGLELSLARAAGEAAEPPEWIQLLPKGPEIVARDGRRWTLADPQVVLAHFADHAADLPLDLEHASELLAPKGEPAPAQAWIKALAIRDGAVWGQVDWTDEGAAAVRNRRYRYVSPAMLHNAAGEITGLSSAGLVTRPALRMPALARQEDRKSAPKQEPLMSQISLAAAAAAAGLAATATEADVLTALAANAQAAKDIRDPSKFVPAADLAAALTRATAAETSLASIQKAASDKTAEELIDGAIAEGKIPPVSKDHWLSIARENLDGATKALASMPALLTPTKKDAKVEGEAGADENGLSADQKALCSQLGLDPKAFAATLKEQA